MKGCENVSSLMTVKSQNFKERNSNFELLRIICIFGIVLMHANGDFLNSCKGANLIYSELINGIFNAGVSIFVLISGYFGIRSTKRKIIKLELDIIFYSVLSSLVMCIINGNISVTQLAKSFIPVSTGKYWFMTGYMILLVFSKYINQIVEQLDKKKLEKLLLLMFAVFSVIPTFLYFHVMKDDGKGIMNMLLLYLTGAYIRKYGKDHYKKSALIIGWFVAFSLSFIANTALSFLMGGVGAKSPFSRDCSLFIIFEAVMVLLFFRELKLKSNKINNFAKHVVAVYMFERAVRALCLNYVFDYTVYADKFYWAFIEVIAVLIVIAICFVFDKVKVICLQNLEEKLTSLLENFWNVLSIKAGNLLCGFVKKS